MAAHLSNLVPETINHLVSVVGEANVLIKSADFDLHDRDQSFHEARRPAAVVWP